MSVYNSPDDTPGKSLHISKCKPAPKAGLRKTIGQRTAIGKRFPPVAKPENKVLRITAGSLFVFFTTFSVLIFHKLCINQRVKVHCKTDIIIPLLRISIAVPAISQIEIIYSV